MFGCCMRIPAVKEERPLIVDLEEILCDKAWNNFKSSRDFCQKIGFRRDKYKIEVPENYFVFEQEQQTITPRNVFKTPEHSASATGNNNADSNAKVDTESTKGKGLLHGMHMTKQELTSPEYVSLDTEFRNETAEGQTYNFKFVKQRTSTVNVSFQKGFTLGGKANFSLGVPALGSPVGVETTMQYQVTKSEGETFQDTMTMEATSNISVGPNSCYTAKVQLDEKKIMADFQVTMRMTMPQKKAPIYIKRKKDDELVFVFYIKHLPDIFSNVSCAKTVKNEENGGDRSDVMEFVVTGVVTGSLACNHNIQLSSDESEEMKKEAKARHFNME